MRKEELLDLHARMTDIKDGFAELPNVPDDAFAEYDALNIEPNDMGRSKDDHKHAIFTLGEAFADVMAEDDLSDAARLKNRMAELAEDASA